MPTFHVNQNSVDGLASKSAAPSCAEGVQEVRGGTSWRIITEGLART